MNQGNQVAPAPAPAPKVTFDPKDVADNKLIATLSYIGILFLVPLLAKKESPFCQYHAKQGLVLCLTWVVGSFVFWFPIIGWLAGLVLLVVNIIAIVKTISGDSWEIPVIYDLSKKFNI